MATHVYWRLLVTDAASSYVKISEMRMYDSSGTSLCTGGTASASSNFSGLPPANAFDIDDTTYWHSNAIPTSGSPQWLQYQFASAVDVATFAVEAALSAGPTACKLQYSDNGSTWTDATSALTPSWATGEVWKTWAITAPATGSYLAFRWTVNSVNAGGSTTPSVAEISLRATSGGSTLSPTGTVYQAKDFFTTGYEANKAFDANTSTIWNANTGAPNWIMALYPLAEAAVEFAWTARNDSLANNQSPSSLTLEGSNNGGVTWTTLATVTPTTWTAGSTQTFTFGGSAAAIAAFVKSSKLIGSGIYV